MASRTPQRRSSAIRAAAFKAGDRASIFLTVVRIGGGDITIPIGNCRGGKTPEGPVRPPGTHSQFRFPSSLGDGSPRFARRASTFAALIWYHSRPPHENTEIRRLPLGTGHHCSTGPRAPDRPLPRPRSPLRVLVSRLHRVLTDR